MEQEQEQEQKKFYQNTLLLTILSALVMGLMIYMVFHINIPNPNMILITVMIFFTGLGGWLPGLVSSIMMLLYSMYFFSTNGSFFQYTDINLQKIMVIVFGIVVNYIVVALLKLNRDKAEALLKDTNKYLSMSNEYLSDKVQTAERIAELSESVNSLLTNMPALTFSKDLNTGKYLACNQAFAVYAKKDNPSGVIGLTDYEIFDPDTAAHFIEDDQKAISMDKPYVFYEDTPDGAGVMRHFQTTKQKFTDTTGRLCVLGMSMDMTELYEIKSQSNKVQKAYEEARSESLTFGNLARSLASDYTNLFYIDLETEEFTEFIPDPVQGELNLKRTDQDFFAAARKDAHTLLYEKDVKPFCQVFTKENVLTALENQKQFSHNYRLLINGVPTYANMKGTLMEGDNRHLVLGVRNVDKQVKAQEAAERIKEERITYARINALSRNYIAIYTVDPETEHYLEYNGSEAYDQLGISKEGDEFFKTTAFESQSAIHPDDLPKFQALFTKENVLKEIRTNGVFSIDYRLMLGGKPVYVTLNAAMVEEKDGAQLVIGVNNVDAQVKRDMEYKQSLTEAQLQANRDELTGVKNKHAYAEMESILNEKIKSGQPVEFAISVFDVNELKTVNDTRGHQAGDELLKTASGMICHAFVHSPVYRIGGDEFAVISRGHDYEHIDEILQKLESQNLKNREQNKTNIAIGMARYAGEENVAAVFEKADHMMYMNKREMKTAG